LTLFSQKIIGDDGRINKNNTMYNCNNIWLDVGGVEKKVKGKGWEQMGS